jgi:hypothetical protein
MTTIDDKVASMVAKKAMAMIDMDALAADVAKTLATSVKAAIIRDSKRWEFRDLLYEAIDGNKELHKLMSAKFINAMK